MAQKFANAARAALSAGIASGDTTITIASGGSLFPEIASPDFSRAVLQDNSGIEIVLITAHTASATSFTVTRGQEGTTARSFDAGAIFGIRVTAADMDEALDAVNLATEVTGTLPIANGGTGQTTRQAAMDALAGAVTSGQYLRGDGTDVVMSALQATDVTGTLAIANGGTGETTRQAAMDALAGAVTSGSYLRGNGTDVVMSAIQAADVPTLNQNTTGTAAGLSATLAVGSGGTGQTTYTDGQLLIGNSTGNTLTKATLTAGTGISVTNAAGSITIAATGGGSTSIGLVRAIAINCILP